MTISIAGRTVQKGDRLYHRGFNLWGQVTKIDGRAVVLLVQGIGNGNVREMRVTDGGMVSGVRQIYWHEPLVLDLPTSDVSVYQRSVDFMKSIMGV